MAYRALTEQGKSFIRSVCQGTGNSLLYGKSKDAIRDTSSNLYNPDGVLPFCYPRTLPTKYWQAKPKHNGKLITTNQDLGEGLIDWFDKYGKQFEMDANITAAQAFAESGYKIWNYPLTSTASGVNQFVMPTVYGMIINNSNFSTAEKAALTVGWSGSTTDPNTFGATKAGMTLLSKRNRPYLHQNISDNPDIMIKAQFVYLKYISDRYTKGIASSTLFAYSRGEGLVFPSYTKSIQKAAAYASGYEMEGVNYVLRIFSLLGKKGYAKYGYFGYDELGMNDAFDPYKAEVAETALNELKS